MPFILAGANHKTCPLATREKFFLQPAEKALLVSRLRQDPRVVSVFILSTCNRTEVYADLTADAPSVILDTFFAVKGIGRRARLERYFYIRREEEAVRHLLRVACGLDSLILGEKQVFGQVREALLCGQKDGGFGRAFNILARIAIETGKKVRRETSLDRGGESISWAAVAKSQQIIGPLAGKTVLVMGAGKMGQLAVAQLAQKVPAKLYVMNRDPRRAESACAPAHGIPVAFWQLREALEEADAVICSTGAPHYLLTRDLVAQVVARRPDRRLALVDISVPRNIDPAAGQVPGVTLAVVDDLAQMVEDSLGRRQLAAAAAERIVAAKVREFYRILDRVAVRELMAFPAPAGEVPCR